MILNDETWNLVENIQYVAKFLGSQDKPKEISEEEVANMMKYVEDSSMLNEELDNYEVGEIIKIIDGPFEDFSAILIFSLK